MEPKETFNTLNTPNIALRFNYLAMLTPGLMWTVTLNIDHAASPI